MISRWRFDRFDSAFYVFFDHRNVIPKISPLGLSDFSPRTVGMKIAQLLVSQRDFLEQQRWAEIRDTTAAGPAGQMFLRDLKKSSA